MSKHTPIPWVIEKCPCGESVCHTYGTSNGRFYQGCGYDLPDAKLIVAAPELLDALLECLPDLEHYAATHGAGPDARLATAKAAIAKATE